MTRPIAWTVLECCDDDPAVRARWLERVITGLTLKDAVEEISALVGAEPTTEGEAVESVRQWLEPQAGLVLEEGLDCLPRQKLEELFQRPELLVGLQELVLTEGGKYWMRRVNEADGIDEIAERYKTDILGPPAQSERGHGGEHVVHPAVAQAALQHATPAVAPGERETPPWKMRRGLFRGLFVVVSLATAAAFVIFVVVPQRGRGPSGGEAVVPGGMSDVMIVNADGSRGTEKPARGEDVHGEQQVAETRRETNSVDGSQPRKPAGAVAGTKPNWPTHPWQTIASTGDGDRIRKTSETIGLLAAAREWSSKLRDADELSAEQLRSAATTARAAVKSLDVLLESERIELAFEARSTVQAKCRAVTAELDQLDLTMPSNAASSDSVLKAKVRLVQVLEELERTLAEGATNPSVKKKKE